MSFSTELPTSSSAVCEQTPHFGSRHTSEKLEIVARYAQAYTTALSKQNFQTVYIDAFAGAGYYRPKGQDETQLEQLSFEPFRSDEGVERLVEGSARRVLGVEPGFSKYVFIEKNKDYAASLEDLNNIFPEKKNSIFIRQQDANNYLKDLCRKSIWEKHRALVFLDPFGMQVEWSTIEMIAQTQAIDLWYLFPVGIGVGRLLNNDGKISAKNQLHLDNVFGTQEWKQLFYKVSQQGDLFSNEEQIVKVVGYNEIERFFVDRLKRIFCGVADRPYRLFNSKGVWLYSMCFAAGNPKGSKVALRIAKHILEEKPWQRIQASSGQR